MPQTSGNRNFNADPRSVKLRTAVRTPTKALFCVALLYSPAVKIIIKESLEQIQLSKALKACNKGEKRLLVRRQEMADCILNADDLPNDLMLNGNIPT